MNKYTFAAAAGLATGAGFYLCGSEFNAAAFVGMGAALAGFARAWGLELDQMQPAPEEI